MALPSMVTNGPVYKLQAPTTGVQALDIGDRSITLSPTRPDEPLTSSTTPDSSGRKRQKRTHVTTVLLNNEQQPPPQSICLNSTAQTQSQSTIDGSGQWDYLLRWEQGDQNVVGFEDLTADDVDVDDDEEVEQDGSGEAAEEDLAEVSDGADGEEAQGRSKLSRDQIVDIINERIEHFTAIWKPNQGVLKGDEINYDPIAMWEKAEVSNERQRIIQSYETDIAYYRQRLDTLCDEIVKFPGKSADAVRHQCRNLEVTVNSIELSEWLLSIYQLDPVENEDEGEHRTKLGQGSLPLVPADKYSMARTQSPVQVIDLGSPPESSQGNEIEEVLVDSSPPPEALSEVREHSPDSVIADTVEHTADIPIVATVGQQAQQSDQPENASISSVRRWRWADLVATKDRKRIVTKALLEMKEEDRETVRSRLSTVGTAELIREIHACMRMLAKNEAKMPGVLSRDMPKIITFTRLFLCWWLCDNYFRVEPSQWDLKDLEKCLQEGSPDPNTFCNYLHKIMATTFGPFALQFPEQPSQAEIIEISDDDDEEPPPRPSATQRKSQVQYSDPIVLD
jgi:hypothetical protein